MQIFDIVGEKGELWLAKNQDDPSNQIGWIWSKHFARLDVVPIDGLSSVGHLRIKDVDGPLGDLGWIDMEDVDHRLGSLSSVHIKDPMEVFCPIEEVDQTGLAGIS